MTDELRAALRHAKYSNRQTHGAHTHGRDEHCGGEFIVGNCMVRAALAATPKMPMLREKIEALPGTDVTGRALDYPGGGSLISRAAVLALLGESNE